MNNYTQLEQYLQDKVFDADDTKVVQFKPEFLTANNLTESSELLNSFTRFYQSLKATINEDENYHELEGYYLREKNWFVRRKPSLGKKDETSNISNKHYQLINEIIIDFNWESLQKHPEALGLYNRALEIKERFDQLIHNIVIKLEETDERKVEPLIKKILAKHPDKEKISNDCRKWIKDCDSWTERHRKKNIGWMFLLQEDRAIRNIGERIWSCNKKEAIATKHNQEKTKFVSACSIFFLIPLAAVFLLTITKYTPKTFTKKELLKHKKMSYVLVSLIIIISGILAIVSYYIWNDKNIAIFAYAMMFFFLPFIFFIKALKYKLKEIENSDQK